MFIKETLLVALIYCVHTQLHLMLTWMGNRLIDGVEAPTYLPIPI